MPINTPREDIKRALAAFSNQPFASAAVKLFHALGYRSERRLKFNSLDEFFTAFDPGQEKVRAAGAATRDWQSLPLLLQITDAEIAAASSGNINPAPGEFEGKHIISATTNVVMRRTANNSSSGCFAGPYFAGS